MRIVCISDTHDMEPLGKLKIPDGDVLVHAGDLTIQGTYIQIQRVGEELARLPHERKLVIAGNHDKLFEKDCALARLALGDGRHGIIYLQDDMVVLGGTGIEGEPEPVEIWGSPWTPRFYDWAFQLDQKRPESERPFLLGSGRQRIASEHWARVPAGVDILITHGPPEGILDRVGVDVPNRQVRHIGDPDLLAELPRIKPKLHIFGHDHSDPGVMEVDGTVFVNAAMCDEAYQIKRRAIVVDYEDGKVTVVEGP
jgi:Icc-related predicted phosphoesterase